MKVEIKSLKFLVFLLGFYQIFADDLTCIREVGKGYFDLTPLQATT